MKPGGWAGLVVRLAAGLVGVTWGGFSAAAFGQSEPPFLRLPPQSAAVADNAWAVLVNPAWLGAGGAAAHLAFPYTRGGGWSEWGWVLSSGIIGFGSEYARDDTTGRRSRHSLGLGWGVEELYGGAAYRWTSGLDRANGWDLGLGFRPLRFMSLGLVVREVNRPRVGGLAAYPGIDLGLGLRPLAAFHPPGHEGDGWLTVWMDASLRRYAPAGGERPRNYGDDPDLRWGASAEPAPGVVVQVTYDRRMVGGPRRRDAQLGVGLSFGFGRFGGGVHHNSRTGVGVAWATAQEIPRRSVLVPERPRYVSIALREPVVEHQTGPAWLAPRRRTLHGFLRQIRHYGSDPEVAGLVVRIDRLEAGWAKVGEMREALLDFRSSGKTVLVFAESLDNRGYYLACAADRIYLAPAGDVDLTGLAAYLTFYRGTLDKVGVDPELEQAGKYKSAVETFTRAEPSGEHREAVESVLDDLYDEFVAALAAGRDLDPDSVRALIDRGPFTASEAQGVGLVDSLVYADQLEDLIEDLEGSRRRIVRESVFRRVRDEDREWFDWRRREVAVVFVTGAIVSGESSEGGLFAGPVVGSATIARALKQAREDDRVAAIVLRVDSPGGSMLASDVIWREVSRCRQESGKPVVVSMSDVAASGGYYVSCSADTILAMPATITGSIGVVSGKFAYPELQRKLGITTATITRGRHADMWSGRRRFTDEERDKLRHQLDQAYAVFVGRVAQGRGMEAAAVDSVAQGRVWTGRQARRCKLVDLEGGLNRAVQVAAQAGGVKEGEGFGVRLLPRRTPLDWDDHAAVLVRAALPQSLQRAFGWWEAERVLEESPLYMMPYDIEIK